VADVATADPEAHPLAEPGERGRLDIRDRAVEHLVAAATLTAPGVHRHGSGIGRLVGRELPRVTVDVAGDHVRATVEVAATWGQHLATVAAAVRDAITRTLATDGGLVVDGVTVHVAAIIEPDSTRTLA
jgi:uncharacterized alkaline shock family protein YloU